MSTNLLDPILLDNLLLTRPTNIIQTPTWSFGKTVNWILPLLFFLFIATFLKLKYDQKYKGVDYGI